MPGKRRLTSTVFTRRQRLGVAVGAVLLLYVVVGVWAALGRQADPVSLAPAPPMFPEEPVVIAAPTTGSEQGDPSAAAPPGGSAAPGEPEETGGDGGGGQDAPSPPAPPPSPRPPAATAGPFTSRYTVTESDSRTFHARVFLTNRGQATRDWSVRITFAPADRVSVGRTLGALKRTSGSTFVFSGFNARPGRTEIFGFDATKGVRGTVRPTGCEIEGRECDIRLG